MHASDVAAKPFNSSWAMFVLMMAAVFACRRSIDKAARIPFLRYAAYRNFGMPGLFRKPDATTSRAGGRASAALY